MLLQAILPPVADDRPKRFLDVVLTKRIAQINGGSVFRGFGVDENTTESFVRFGRDVGVAWRRVAVEKGVADPFLEHNAVFLDFLWARRDDESQKEDEERETNANHGGKCRGFPIRAKT